SDHDAIKTIIAQQLNLQNNDFDFIIKKRSVDARQRPVKYVLKVEVFHNEQIPEKKYTISAYENVSDKPSVIIVGSGPAGLFAALKCLENKLKPIVLERGKNVRDRRRDLAKIHKEHVVNSESNYCFGEGGAGTYSDGKLYTRSTKRGHVQEVLELLVQHGASEDILIDAHPHIGTNKLPQIIQSIRETIINSGGEVHFDSKVVDFIIEKNQIKGVVLEDGKEFLSKNVILATGHSARDIFYLLHKKNIEIEFKPFALGVRIEHSQELIDELQYKLNPRGEFLP
ncbi:MAG: NAD(P)/FAD-dependent oxidoreductase, partial [Bacteroidia bacterium]